MAHKLYTEEQVRKAFYDGIFFASSAQFTSTLEHNKYFEGVIKSLTPIELPSDEKINNVRITTSSYDRIIGFIAGAKWMKEQILNQNK